MYSKFIDYCIEGNLEEAKKLYSLRGVNIHAYGEEAFILSCCSGQMNVAQWLYSLGGVDIHANNDYAFRLSCRNGHMNVAELLYSIGNIHIHAINEYAFRGSCQNNHNNITLWLLTIDKFDNELVDKFLPKTLYEYAFQLGYLPTNKMKLAYEEYKPKIKEQIKEKRIDGPISLFEIDGLVDLIVCYV